MYLVLVERSGAEDGLSSVELMFYNGILSLPFLLFIIIAMGEFPHSLSLLFEKVSMQWLHRLWFTHTCLHTRTPFFSSFTYQIDACMYKHTIFFPVHTHIPHACRYKHAHTLTPFCFSSALRLCVRMSWQTFLVFQVSTFVLGLLYFRLLILKVFIELV